MGGDTRRGVEGMGSARAREVEEGMGNARLQDVGGDDYQEAVEGMGGLQDVDEDTHQAAGEVGAEEAKD